MILGCMEIIYEHLNLKVNRAELLASFGQDWTVQDVCRYLAGFGYFKTWENPQDGDIIFVGNHPGIVQGDRVANYHRNRLTWWPLRRLRPDLVLRQTCR